MHSGMGTALQVPWTGFSPIYGFCDASSDPVCTT